ncbi:hypothetical protein H5407_17630 [Mitsuaria sp. WAJ17]|uniref:hypothetical protein n=1 Tax=Mitsuaria sp. WAJ17 TaxID=2761452 RepID=UPI001601478C|nr:hypothetical protein [Mitsuaria sp. WAJ17]MBB2487054.1 hypothetical protein [Mitsuaria sp. WAJ17]
MHRPLNPAPRTAPGTPRPPRTVGHCAGRSALLGGLCGLALMACGGGGGGATTTTPAPAPAPATSTSLSSLPLSGPPPASFRAPATMPASILESAFAKLPPDPGHHYLVLYVQGPGEASASTLWIGRWRPGSELPRVQVPLAVKTIQFELYNAAGSVSGTWSL